MRFFTYVIRTECSEHVNSFIDAYWAHDVRKKNASLENSLYIACVTIATFLFINAISHFEIAIYHCIMGLFWGTKTKQWTLSLYIYMER